MAALPQPWDGRKAAGGFGGFRAAAARIAPPAQGAVNASARPARQCATRCGSSADAAF
jgi:hypothetical protein